MNQGLECNECPGQCRNNVVMNVQSL